MNHMIANPFLTINEISVAEQFIERGYLIQDVESMPELERIRELISNAACQYLGISTAVSENVLDNLHKHLSTKDLNDLRLSVISTINSAEWIRPAYFRLARKALESIVGNELSMQLRLNLSIQMPEDDSSLLPIHADTWSGDSPYEIVVWLPLVDCYNTKSMFFLPSTACAEPARMLSLTHAQDSESLFNAVEKDLIWLNVRYGQVLLFNQNLPHGNRINHENETRWSMNCRFKGVFTPYADKRLGEFFEPITLRPASRIGIEYQLSENKQTELV